VPGKTRVAPFRISKSKALILPQREVNASNRKKRRIFPHVSDAIEDTEWIQTIQCSDIYDAARAQSGTKVPGKIEPKDSLPINPAARRLMVRVWFNGRIEAFQVSGKGSIPFARSIYS
jgi:hypothetical protein